MNVDMNVDDLLKEIEAKRKSQAAPMRRLEDVCRDCANAYVHMDRARLASLKQELYPFSTATVPSRKAKSKDRPKDTVLNRLTNVLAQRLQIADEGNRALVGTTLEHMKAYKAASTSSHRQLKQRQDEAQAAENEWNQRADTHAQQLFSQEQTNTLQVESDFQRLQPSRTTSLLEGGAAHRLANLDDATTSMVTRAKDWDTRHAKIDGVHKELRSEVQRVLTDFRTRAQEEYLAATEELRRTTLSDIQRSIGQIQAQHGAKDLPLQFELTALQADAQQRDMDASKVFQTFAKRSEQCDRQVRRDLYLGLSKMRFFTGK